MSERDYKLYIHDIIRSIDNILEYTEGLDENGFIKDKKTIDAAIRNFEVTGEAANKLPPDVKTQHPEVPRRDMIDFRNRITHEYFGVSPGIVWQIINKELPLLKQNMNKI